MAEQAYVKELLAETEGHPNDCECEPCWDLWMLQEDNEKGAPCVRRDAPRGTSRHQPSGTHESLAHRAPADRAGARTGRERDDG